jgi:methylenetetrahydrofolate dehydrogenase (NADP+) / methenyltetrahydrofolate cyclohydrolase
LEVSESRGSFDYQSVSTRQQLDKGTHRVSARILDGKRLASEIQHETARKIADFTAQHSIQPRLVAVLVGDDPASEVYVRNKQKTCEKLGMAGELIRLESSTSQAELLRIIEQLNGRSEVHGILVQLPLPRQLEEQRVLDAVHPLKDVDCFHPENVGLLSQERPRFLPCTPHGVLQVLHRSGIPAEGRHAVIVGRSEIVGKPLAALLSAKQSHLGPEAANATVTLCHSRTNDLPSHTRQADILIAAIGKPKFITAEMVKPGGVVIDVGINRTDQGLVGDVDFTPVSQICSAITPVPGGIGPLTIAMLMENTLAAARLAVGLRSAENP